MLREMVEAIHGDARDVIHDFPDAHFDAVITDPPYGVAVGRNSTAQHWDLPSSNAAFDVSFWRDVRRTLKPGASLAAFGSPRKYHRLVSAIEDAGFWIVDTVAWIHGQGVAAGNRNLDVELQRHGWDPEQAAAYEGWGTTLRPSLELIVIARNSGKSLSTAIANGGVGGLNIAATRIPTDDARSRRPGTVRDDALWALANRTEHSSPHAGGRYPGNVLLEHAGDCTETSCESGCPVAIVRAQGAATRGRREDASRFHRALHHPKASATERPRIDGVISPPVKPLGIMDWLVELLTRPGQVILDPFAGTGTTLEAAARYGVRSVGIERDTDTVRLVEKRLAT